MSHQMFVRNTSDRDFLSDVDNDINNRIQELLTRGSQIYFFAGISLGLAGLPGCCWILSKGKKCMNCVSNQI